MTINWWSLAIQAFNVLLLVWLLSHVFWRPVARAIAMRQDGAKNLLNDAETARTQADAALAEVSKIRIDLATERDTVLSEALRRSEAAAISVLAVAAEKAEAKLKAAELAIEVKSDAALANNAANSASLAVDIAQKLLARLAPTDLQAPFLDLLVDTIAGLSEDEKQTLIETRQGIDIVSAIELSEAAKEKFAQNVDKVLGAKSKLNFQCDPNLIAGLELRTPHFILHNSWRSDLTQILKELNNAV